MNNTITIAIETCFLFDQYANRGIGRYGKEIYSRLVQEIILAGRALHILWIGYNGLEDNLDKLFDGEIPNQLAQIEFVSLGDPKQSSPLVNLMQYKLQIKPAVLEHKPDLYFAVYFERGLPSDIVPCVVTAHDAIPLRTGKFNNRSWVFNKIKGIYYKHMWNKQKKAALIFTDSNTAAKELSEFGKLRSELIEPVYLGISEVFGNSLEQLGSWQDNLPFDVSLNNYLIYDGGLEPTKQVPLLLDQFAELLKYSPDLKLVLTGRDFEPANTLADSKLSTPGSREIYRLANNLGITKNIIPVGSVSQNTLVGLFKHAKGYINFSGYEGFGFGPLQAMKAGVPAIIGDNECFKEVSAGGALMLDPTTPKENAKRIIDLLNNKDLHASQVANGQKHAANFTWDHTWKTTKSLLERLCASLI